MTAQINHSPLSTCLPEERPPLQPPRSLLLPAARAICRPANKHQHHLEPKLSANGLLANLDLSDSLFSSLDANNNKASAAMTAGAGKSSRDQVHCKSTSDGGDKPGRVEPGDQDDSWQLSADSATQQRQHCALHPDELRHSMIMAGQELQSDLANRSALALDPCTGTMLADCLTGKSHLSISTTIHSPPATTSSPFGAPGFFSIDPHASNDPLGHPLHSLFEPPASPPPTGPVNMFPPSSEAFTFDSSKPPSSSSTSFFESFHLPSTSSSSNPFIWSRPPSDLTLTTTTSPFSLWPSSTFLASSLSQLAHRTSPAPAPAPVHQRQHSSADSSYDSDSGGCGTAGDGDALAKIVGDIVDSTVATPESELPPVLLEAEVVVAADGQPSATLTMHEDVNRTTSETLAQEYSEWSTSKVITTAEDDALTSETVTPSEATVNASTSSSSTTTVTAEHEPTEELDKLSVDSWDSDDSDAKPKEPIGPTEVADLADPEEAEAYAEKLKFALKLGYTEEQVCLAISTVGVKAAKNDLLNQLIRIGAVHVTANGTIKPPLAKQSATVAHSQKELLRSSHSPPGPGATRSDAAATTSRPALRPIVIDGSNVAISHGNKEVFSCRGIRIAIDWFRARGHTEIVAFVPMWRKQQSTRFEVPIRGLIDREVLLQLEAERYLVFTPSRNVSGRLLACYDDRYVLNLALKNNGIIVSNDNYRDLISENADYRRVVEERLLMYTFVNDEFMPPDDPFGRGGPRLEQFLRMPEHSQPASASFAQPCPYEKKCTYGNKCKYYHPERAQRPIADQLAESSRQMLSGQSSHPTVAKMVKQKAALKGQQSLPVNFHSVKAALLPTVEGSASAGGSKRSLCRTKSIVSESMTTAGVSTTATVSSSASPPDPKPSTSNATESRSPLHRKLERQLTLNPFSQANKSSLASIWPQSSSSSLSSSPSNLTVPSTATTSSKSKLVQTKSWGNPVGHSGPVASTASHDLPLRAQALKPFSKSSRALNEPQPLTSSKYLTPPTVLLNDVALPMLNGATSWTGSKLLAAKPSPGMPGSLAIPPAIHSHPGSQPFIQLPFPHPLLQQQEYQQHQRLHQMLSAINERANAAVLAGTAQSVQRKTGATVATASSSSSKGHATLQQSHSTSSLVSASSPRSHITSTNSSPLAGSSSNWNNSRYLTVTQSSTQPTANMPPKLHRQKAIKGRPKAGQKQQPSSSRQSTSGKGHSAVTRNHSAPDAAKHTPTNTAQALSHLNPNVAPFEPATSKSSTNLASSSCSSSSVTASSVASLPEPTQLVPPPLPSTSANVWSYDQPDEGAASSSWDVILKPKKATAAERRQKILFHLSAIFPAEQVQSALASLPDETDPQLICARILNTQKAKSPQ